MEQKEVGGFGQALSGEEAGHAVHQGRRGTVSRNVDKPSTGVTLSWTYISVLSCIVNGIYLRRFPLVFFYLEFAPPLTNHI